MSQSEAEFQYQLADEKKFHSTSESQNHALLSIAASLIEITKILSPAGGGIPTRPTEKPDLSQFIDDPLSEEVRYTVPCALCNGTGRDKYKRKLCTLCKGNKFITTPIPKMCAYCVTFPIGNDSKCVNCHR